MQSDNESISVSCVLLHVEKSEPKEEEKNSKPFVTELNWLKLVSGIADVWFEHFACPRERGVLGGENGERHNLCLRVGLGCGAHAEFGAGLLLICSKLVSLTYTWKTVSNKMTLKRKRDSNYHHQRIA